MTKNKAVLNQIRELPKIELHRHLDGAIRPETIFQLARKNKIDIPFFNLKGLKKFYRIAEDTSIAEIMAKFNLVISLMQTPENLQAIAYQQVLDLKKENIIYAELRFAPQYHDKKGLSYSEIIEHVLIGMRKGYQQTGVLANLIICIGREIESDLGEKVVKSALKFQDETAPVRVVGIDLACDEVSFPPERHLSAYRLTFNSNLRRTVHVGEFGEQKLENIATAINLLQADRLGHAIPLPDDSKLLKLVKQRNIGIETNPISNLICHIIKDVGDLQLNSYLQYGVSFSINSDDPAMMFKSLADNLNLVKQHHNWSWTILKIIMLDTIKMSFASPTEKNYLSKECSKVWSCLD